MASDGIPAAAPGFPLVGPIPEHAVAAILDSIPCGVLVLDRNRRIRGVNEAFTRALQTNQASCLGSCQGSVLGCLYATEADHHQSPPAVCEDCELAAITSRAFDSGKRIRGRATLQVVTDGRLRDMTLECTALPVTVSAQDFVVVLIDSMDELHGLRSLTPTDSTLGMVGRHESMLELFEIIRQVGSLRVPVIIQGESGTGKELVAQALHLVSPRNEGMMVTVHCGALPDTLLESELFGHVKGAFTGAHRDRKGRFALADGGTIFLDEIGELSPAMQVKFLRVLQDGTFEPVGSERTVKVDARVLCATNRNLETEVARGRFRADLYYRLCVVPIQVPPLRARADDILLLASHFLERFAGEHPSWETSLTDQALSVLMKHPWPGNVRELENALRYAIIRARGAPIQCRHLPTSLGARCSGRSEGRPRLGLDPRLVQQALTQAGGNRTRAAESLGVSRTTLWRFLREHPEAEPAG